MQYRWAKLLLLPSCVCRLVASEVPVSMLHATSPRNSTRNTPHMHKRGKPSVQTPHIPPQVLGDAQPAHEHEEAGGAGEAKKEDLWEWGWETVGAGNGRMQMWRLR